MNVLLQREPDTADHVASDLDPALSRRILRGHVPDPGIGIRQRIGVWEPVAQVDPNPAAVGVPHDGKLIALAEWA